MGTVTLLFTGIEVSTRLWEQQSQAIEAARKGGRAMTQDAANFLAMEL